MDEVGIILIVLAGLSALAAWSAFGPARGAKLDKKFNNAERREAAIPAPQEVAKHKLSLEESTFLHSGALDNIIPEKDTRCDEVKPSTVLINSLQKDVLSRISGHSSSDNGLVYSINKYNSMPILNLEIKEDFGWKRGSINANRNSWHISIFVPGRDRRYNGVIIYIGEAEVQKLISDYQKSYLRFSEIKDCIDGAAQSLGGGTAQAKETLGRLTIHVGVWPNGIYLENHSLSVSNKKDLDHVVNCLKRAADRGPKLVAAVQELSTENC